MTPMLFLALLGCPKSEPPKMFVEDFPRTEPAPTPELPPLTSEDCEPQAVSAGDVVGCTGILTSNRTIEQCRINTASFEFWESEARAQWRYRSIDRAACEVRVSALETANTDLIKRHLWQKIETPVAFGAGALTTVLVLWAAREALRDSR